MILKEYYTVGEFAELVGSSRTNIYNQLTGRLKPYVISIDNKTHISVNAFHQFYETKLTDNSIEVSQDQSIFNQSVNQFQSSVNQSVNQSQSSVNHSVNQSQSAETALNLEIIELLRKDLENQRAQIESLTQQITAKDQQINELHTLLSQQQQLQLATQTQYQQLLATTQAADQDTEEQPPQPKKRFFDFLKKSK